MSLVFIRVFWNHLVSYPTPISLNYLWSFGFLSGLFFSFQIITGLLVTIHYSNHIELAFLSVEHIMRNVNFGWLIRYLHANGASFFFIMVYIHILRGLYYKSFFNPKSSVWLSGCLILVIMIITSFLGYVLPWGQMSFWAATVITNLVTVIPGIGSYIVSWLWGGFAVGNPTLGRFFMLHYLLPFILMFLIIIHISCLHIRGSSNPLNIKSYDYIPFYPYFILKDCFLLCCSLVCFMTIVFFYPNILSHSDNYIEANSLVTPNHIIPEWYFLFYHAISRSIPNKLGGVCVMFLALISLVCLIFIYNLLTKISLTNIFSPSQYFYNIGICFFISICVLLSWLGQNVVEVPFIALSLYLTKLYFCSISLLICILICPLFWVYDQYYTILINQWK